MTATGMTYGDALYELAADEALTDELLEQVKLLGDLFRLNPRYLALLATRYPTGGTTSSHRRGAFRTGTPLSCQFPAPAVSAGQASRLL